MNPQMQSLIKIYFIIFSFGTLANSKPLICHYYKLNHDPSSNNFGTSEGGYLWANLDIPGHLEDGFWVTALKQTEATDLCSKIIALEKGKDYRLLSIKAGSLFTEDSIVFSDSQKRLVIFGDSYSDDGNIKRWFRFYPASPYFYGRFTNGPVWNEYLSLHQNVATLNWAHGGMTTKSFAKFETWVSGNLADYVGKHINQLPSKQVTSPEKTLFLFWAGPNDFYHGGDSHGIIRNIQQQIERLAAVGAKHFAVINTLDFSESPCSECYKHTQILNTIWPEQWRQFSIPGIHITHIDVENIHRQIIRSDLKIKANSTQCFKGWWSKGSSNPIKDTCPQVSQSFFYDDVHPTTTAHCWLSFYISSEVLMRSHNDEYLQYYHQVCSPTP